MYVDISVCVWGGGGGGGGGGDLMLCTPQLQQPVPLKLHDQTIQLYIPSRNGKRNQVHPISPSLAKKKKPRLYSQLV